MGGVGVATVAAPELRETKIMENPNFDNASIVVGKSFTSAGSTPILSPFL